MIPKPRILRVLQLILPLRISPIGTFALRPPSRFTVNVPPLLLKEEYAPYGENPFVKRFFQFADLVDLSLPLLTLIILETVFPDSFFAMLAA